MEIEAAIINDCQVFGVKKAASTSIGHDMFVADTFMWDWR
jgi:hypothetical protein